jgi:hypothetical protein
LIGGRDSQAGDYPGDVYGSDELHTTDRFLHGSAKMCGQRETEKSMAKCVEHLPRLIAAEIAKSVSRDFKVDLGWCNVTLSGSGFYIAYVPPEILPSRSSRV